MVMLACADYLGVGYDQVIVGWRGISIVPEQIIYTPDSEGET